MAPDKRNRPGANGPAPDDQQAGGSTTSVTPGSLRLPAIPLRVAELLAAIKPAEAAPIVKRWVYEPHARMRVREACDRVQELVGTVDLETLLVEMRVEFVAAAAAITEAVGS